MIWILNKVGLMTNFNQVKKCLHGRLQIIIPPIKLNNRELLTVLRLRIVIFSRTKIY